MIWLPCGTTSQWLSKPLHTGWKKNGRTFRWYRIIKPFVAPFRCEIIYIKFVHLLILSINRFAKLPFRLPVNHVPLDHFPWISSQNEKYTKWLRKSHWIGYLKLVVSYICHCFRSHILWNLELKKKKLKLEKWREKWYEIQKSHNHSHREQVDKNVYDICRVRLCLTLLPFFIPMVWDVWSVSIYIRLRWKSEHSFWMAFFPCIINTKNHKSSQAKSQNQITTSRKICSLKMPGDKVGFHFAFL